MDKRSCRWVVVVSVVLLAWGASGAVWAEMQLQNWSIAADSTYGYGALQGTVTDLGGGNVITNLFDGEAQTMIRGVGATAQPYANVTWTAGKGIKRIWLQHGNGAYPGEGYKFQTWNGASWTDIPGAGRTTNDYAPMTQIFTSFAVDVPGSLGIRYQETQDNPGTSPYLGGWIMRLDDIYLWNRDVEDGTVNLTAAPDLTVTGLHFNAYLSTTIRDRDPFSGQDLIVTTNQVVGPDPSFDPAEEIFFTWTTPKWVEGVYYLPRYTSYRQMSNITVYVQTSVGGWDQVGGPVTIPKTLGSIRIQKLDFGSARKTKSVRVTFGKPAPNGMPNSSYVELSEIIISAGTAPRGTMILLR